MRILIIVVVVVVVMVVLEETGAMGDVWYGMVW